MIFQKVGFFRVSLAMTAESVSEPLLSYMPDGPRWFSKIVLDNEAILSSDVVRAEEESPTIVVTARVKSVFENGLVRGLQFKD